MYQLFPYIEIIETSTPIFNHLFKFLLFLVIKFKFYDKYYTILLSSSIPSNKFNKSYSSQNGISYTVYVSSMSYAKFNGVYRVF